MSGGCFWFWSSMCVCGWMRRVRFIPTGKGGLGLRLNLTLLTAGVDLNCAPHGSPLLRTHTHQETAYSLLHIFTQEPQTPETEKANIRYDAETHDSKKSNFLKGLFHLCGE